MKICTLLLGLSGFAAAGATAQSPAGFYAAMDQAMTRMHAMMMAAPSGNPDRDFAAMMIPHHQGAIEMAEAELAYGKDDRLRRLAQGIIVEQRQEIAVMRGILDEHNGAPRNGHHPVGDMK